VQWLRLALSRGPNRVSLPRHLRTETDKSKKPVILSVILHCQNSLESTNNSVHYNVLLSETFWLTFIAVCNYVRVHIVLLCWQVWRGISEMIAVPISKVCHNAQPLKQHLMHYCNSSPSPVAGFSYPWFSFYVQFLQTTGFCFMYPCILIYRVTERCTQTLGTSFTFKSRTNVPINMWLKAFNLRVVAERILCRHQQQYSINMWAGIVSDCSVGLHVLPHWLTNITEISSYMILQSYWNIYHWQSERKCGTCMIVLRHILAVLCQMFSVTPITTNE
jgi:hypothetical protein